MADDTQLVYGTMFERVNEMISMEIYEPAYFAAFNPSMLFDKWAVMEVTDFSEVPEGMETFTIPAGLYAVFIHKGLASEGPRTFQYIFVTWIPNSEYMIDDRPHFEVMGERYKNNAPDSEEELWIPIRPR